MNKITGFIMGLFACMCSIAQTNGNIPENLQNFDVDENSAILSWNKTEDTYKYIVSYTTPLAETEIEKETLDTFLIIGDLASATQYLWRVKTVNYNLDTSDWSYYAVLVTLGTDGNCSDISDLTISQITNNSITLQWTSEDSDVKYWELVCDEIDVNPDVSAVRIYTTDLSATFNNLEQSKIYKISSRTHCNGDIGQWNSIFVRCINDNYAFDLPISLSFSDKDTNDYIGFICDKINTWTFNSQKNESSQINDKNYLLISNTGGETASYDTTHASVSYAYFTINVPEESIGLSLDFDYMSNLTCQQAGLSVFFTPAGSNVKTQSLPFSLYQFGNSFYNNTEGKWQNAQVELPNYYAGQKMKIMFVWTNDSSCTDNNSVAIDNIRVKARYCAVPDSLRTLNVQTNSADLYWFVPNNQTKYSLEYKRAEDNQWIILNDVNSGYYLSGLEDNTQYQWRLKALCEEEESLYSVTDTFTTKTVILPIETDSITYTVGYNSASFYWPMDTDIYLYTVSYRENNITSPWTDTIVSTNYCHLTTLQSNTEYAFKVRKINSENVASKYSKEIIFSTLCMPVTQYPYTLPNVIQYNNQSGFVNAPVCYSQEYSELTSVTFDFSNLEVPLLSFEEQTNSQINVYISADGGETYEKIAQYESYDSIVGYTSHSIILNDYAKESNVRFRFVFVASDLSKIMGAIKNISLQNACSAPALISVDSVELMAATLSWTPSDNVSQWRIRVYKSDNSYIAQYYTSEPKLKITGLDSLTTYKCIITATCSDEVSFDSSETYFTTAGTVQMECSKPKNMIAYWYPKKSDETILVSWDAEKDIYTWEVYYKELNAVNWQTKTITVTPQFSIRNLSEGGIWLVKVRTICAPGDTSEFTDTDTILVGNSALKSVDNAEDYIRLYPNPATENIVIELNNVVVKDAILLNTENKILAKWKELPSQIDIHHLPAGNYYIVGYINNIQFVKRFIKN